MIDTVLAAPAYQWSEAAPRLSWLARLWGELIEWISRLRESNPAAVRFLFWTLVVVLIAIFVHGGAIMYRTIRNAGAPPRDQLGATAVAVRDDRWYQRRAEALAAEGRYAEAMHAAFTAQMLRFDARGILRFHPSKTPREYAREAKLAEESRHRLLDAVGSLYACAYAGRPCDPMQFRDWLSGLRGEWHAAQN